MTLPRKPRLGLVAMLLTLIALVASRTEGAELRLNLVNDFLGSNELSDDLYTFGFELGYSFGRYEISFSEDAFTDSTHPLRFDESYLRIRRAFSSSSGWTVDLSIGVLRVGDGLFGESTQNSLHRLIGNDEVDLPYVSETLLFPTFSAAWSRTVPLSPTLSLVPKAEFTSSTGFKTSSALRLELLWRASSSVWIGAELGGRYTETTFAPLEPWVARTAPVWKLTLGLPNNLALAWAYNEYGTEFQHISLGYRWSVGSVYGADGRS